MKKRICSFAVFLLAAVSVVLILKGFEHWLDGEIDRLYDADKYALAINQQNENLTKEMGKELIQKAVENHNLVLLGSSELDSWIPQNPMYFFPNTQVPQQISLIGHAYMQDLIHAMKVGTENFGHGEKVAIVISLQWFMDEDIDINGFAANFSELQFYDTMKNQRLSRETKEKICSRTKGLLQSVDGYDDIKTYVQLYSSKPGNLLLTLLKPYYELKYYFLEIRDKWDTYQVLKTAQTMTDGQEIAARKIDWEKEFQKAEETGKAACTNNEFYVEDQYYDTYLRDQIDEIQDSYAGEYLESREWEDYELFLQVCKENQVEPYLIFMNTNGRYYDYQGIDQERRNTFYDKLEDLAKDYGFDYLRLSDKEYEPYFMQDVMHLGWKGWLYVDEALTEHYTEK